MRRASFLRRYLWLALVMAVVVAGCQQGLRRADPTPIPTPIATLATGTLVTLGTLTVCADLRREPYAGDLEGRPDGLDIGIGWGLATLLRLTLEVVDTPFAEIGSALRSGGCDIAIGGIRASSLTARGLEVVPYHEVSETLFVKRFESLDPAAIRDLCGRRIAVQHGSDAQAQVAGTDSYAGRGLSAACTASGRGPIAVHVVATVHDAVVAVFAGEVDGFLADSVLASPYQEPGGWLRSLEGVVAGTDQLVIVLRDGAGGDLERAIEAALAALVRDGFLDLTFTE